jgi:hypothetical protein
VKPREYTKWKVVLGLVLLVLTPLSIFSIPNTAGRIVYDLAGGLWWTFVGWLLWSGGLGRRLLKSNDDPNEMARWVP